MKLRRFFTFCLVALLLSGFALTAVPAMAQSTEADATPDVSGTYVSNVYPAASAPGLVLLLTLYPNNSAELISYYFSNPPVIEEGTWKSGDDNTVTVTWTGNNNGPFQQPSTEVIDVKGDTLVSSGIELNKLPVVTPEEMEANAAATPEATGAAEEVSASEAVTSTEETTETESVASSDAVTPTEGMTVTESASDYKVFVTPVYPAADASGMVMVLALFPNHNLEQMTAYLGKDAIVEVGTWAGTDTGDIGVTLTGMLDNKPYDNPSTTIYTYQDDTLTDGAFTFNPLPIVTPAELQAMTSPAGTYVSKLYPAADASGLLTVLSLYENNNAEQVSIYLGKAVIVEQGTWAENADGSIAVTMTGTTEQQYEKPIETTYQRNGNTLSDGTYELTRAEVVTPEEMNAATGEAASSGEAEADAALVAAVFKSDTLVAADSPGRAITLTLYDDGKAEMTTDFLNDKPLIVETGTWVSPEEQKFTVTITGDDQGEYAKPIVIGFEESADGTLTAVDYDESLFGSEGLTLHAVENSK